MSISKFKNSIDQNKEDQFHNLMESMTEINVSLEEVHLTEKQKELLSFFWHKVDQEVIEELPKQAIEYIYFTNCEKHRRMDSSGKLRSVYASLHNSGMFEEPAISNVPDTLRLSKSGIRYVMKANPIYSQGSLLLLKLWENKLSFLFALVGFVGSLFSIFGTP